MIIIPAIDLYENAVVRLRQGNYEDKTIYSLDPIEWGKYLYDLGFRHLHLIDLEGARKGKPCHLMQLKNLASLGFQVHYGGGLRTATDIQDALEHGASKIYLGSLLAKDTAITEHILSTFGRKIIPAVDVINGRVSISGWLDITDIRYDQLISRLAKNGFSRFLVTSISRDGVQKGPDISLYRILVSLFPSCEFIAAGGITVLDDIKKLGTHGCWGAILGKSLYEQTISSEELRKVLLNVADQEDNSLSGC